MSCARRSARLGWRSRLAALGLAALIAASLLWLAGRTTLWDRDEPRFAQATVEMVASGNYLVPTFNGRLRPDKPILLYWLMSLPVRLLGPTVRAVRLWAPVGTALAALATFLIGRRLFTTGAGRWAMAMLAATPLAVIEGQAATTDAVLLAAIAAAAACSTAALDGGEPRRRAAAWWGLGVALGLAQLAKGPIGLLLPSVSIAAHLWLLRGDSLWSPAPPLPCAPGWAMPPSPSPSPSMPAALASPAPPAAPAGFAPPPRAALHAALAALLGVAIFCAWGVPANLATRGELARLGLGKHFAGRALGALEGHGAGGRWAGLPFYLAVVWIGFLPWTAYLPAAVSAALGGRLGGRRGSAFLLAWGLPPVLLMSLAATRLPHYILPAWPALALAAGATLDAERRGALAPRDLACLRRGAWLLALPVAGLALLATAGVLLALHPGVAGAPIAGQPAASAAHARAASAAGAPAAAALTARAEVRVVGRTAMPAGTALAPIANAPMVSALAPPALALAAVLCLAGAAMLALLVARRPRPGLAALAGLAGAAAALVAAGGALAPAVERLKPAPALAAAVRAEESAGGPAGMPVATFGYAEPSFTFYLRRWPVAELPTEDAAAAWAADPRPGVLILPRPALDRLRLTAPPRAAHLLSFASARGWNVANGAWLDLVAVRRAPPSRTPRAATEKKAPPPAGGSVH